MIKFKNVSRIPIYIFMAILCICALLPFYLMIVMGTHYSEDLYTGVKLTFGDYFLQNLHTIMQQDFLRYYCNSIIVAVCHVVGAVLVSALTGYAFAKFDFKGKKILFAVIVGTLAIPEQLGLSDMYWK